MYRFPAFTAVRTGRLNLKSDFHMPLEPAG